MTCGSPLRARWLQALALATDADIDAIHAELGVRPEEFEMLRAPQVGTVMAKARVGGSGSSFNLGETTVTRSAVRSSGGTVGIGWVQGRRPRRAADIARLDAVLQVIGGARAAELVHRLEAELSARRAVVARKAAATRVEFFTLVRGED